MKTKSYFLRIVWGVSRGRDTYGYNTCTAYVDGNKIARCMGGGYDMTGTVLGDVMEHLFKEELQHFADKQEKSEQGQRETSHYGLFRRDDGTVYLDGGCGRNSMETVLQDACGYCMRCVDDRKKNENFYMLEPVQE